MSRGYLVLHGAPHALGIAWAVWRTGRAFGGRENGKNDHVARSDRGKTNFIRLRFIIIIPSSGPISRKHVLLDCFFAVSWNPALCRICVDFKVYTHDYTRHELWRSAYIAADKLNVWGIYSSDWCREHWCNTNRQWKKYLCGVYTRPD
jgi:hypothetical protein